MQQVSATLETKLPQALVRQSAALKEKYAGPQDLKKNSEPENPAAETPQGASAAETVDTKPQPAGDPRENDIEYWKHRVKVMTGILRSERDDRKAQTATLNQRIAELLTELQAARDAVPEPEGDLGEFFSPEQIEDMGETAARATYTAIKKQIKTQLDAAMRPIVESQASKQADDHAARVTAFTDRLAELVPDYAEIDVSDDWRSWLAEETRDGMQRQEILNRHTQAFNAERTAAMFEEFRATQTRPTPPITPTGSGAAQPTSAVRASQLTSPSKAEIKDFYKRHALGKVSPQEVARFEERMALLSQ